MQVESKDEFIRSVPKRSLPSHRTGAKVGKKFDTTKQLDRFLTIFCFFLFHKHLNLLLIFGLTVQIYGEFPILPNFGREYFDYSMNFSIFAPNNGED